MDITQPLKSLGQMAWEASPWRDGKRETWEAADVAVQNGFEHIASIVAVEAIRRHKLNVNAIKRLKQERPLVQVTHPLDQVTPLLHVAAIIFAGYNAAGCKVSYAGCVSDAEELIACVRNREAKIAASTLGKDA